MTTTAAARTYDLAAPTPRREQTVRVRTLALWFIGWSALVVVMAGAITAQKSVPFKYALRSESVNYYTLALASLVVWFASARLSATSWSRGAQIAAHIALGLVLTIVWQAIYGAYLWSIMGPAIWDRMYRGTWMFLAMNAFVLYGGVLAGTLAIQAARRAREQELRQHALALAAREAELRALNAQLEPHFLLNTLNSVLALVDDRSKDARLMIERLSELLKAAFDEMDEADVPLGRELDLLTAYLGIEEVRFGDRLRVTIDVPDAIRRTRVPPFLLQPIVENAIKHAVTPYAGAAFITIRGRADNGRLRLEVIDSGKGFEYAAAARRGRGLELAERRLTAHAPDGEIGVERTASGFAVVVTLPA